MMENCRTREHGPKGSDAPLPRKWNGPPPVRRGLWGSVASRPTGQCHNRVPEAAYGPRTVRDTLNLIHELAERGVGVRNLADPIRVDSSNPADPMAQLAVVLLALFGQMERT